MSAFKIEIEKAFNTALGSPIGGGEEWNNMLAGYGIIPLSDEEKNLIFSAGTKITKGAFPVELRRVFEKIKEKYSDLENFDIDKEIEIYDKKIKPSAAFGSIFKTAFATSSKYSMGLKGEKQHTIKCKSCGAPRLEEMQYDYCLYCGSKLFVNE